MTDYTKNHDYSDKDALASGDINKIVLGQDIDDELDELQTVIATKYDVSDIATQAQAEAGVSNSVLITPLRMAQYLTGAAGGSGAGMVGDIITLADPNADRILFWDDSAGAVALLQVSTGLQIVGTVLSTKDSEIVHNSLSGYDANRHIDHTAVSITAGSGLTGGGTIDATRTLALDIVGLTTDNTVDQASDYIPYYDAGEGANNKVLMSTIAGVALGDGRWYRAATQSIPAALATTIVFETAGYNSLQRGSFSLATGLYTAGSAGSRVTFMAQFAAVSLAASRSMTIIVSASSGGEVARASFTNLGSGTMTLPTVSVSGNASLASGETLSVAAFFTTVANTLPASTSGLYNLFSIVELA